MKRSGVKRVNKRVEDEWCRKLRKEVNRMRGREGRTLRRNERGRWGNITE